MRKLTLAGLGVGLLALGVLYWMKVPNSKEANSLQNLDRTKENIIAPKEFTSLLTPHHRRELARIGEVINQDNVQIDHATKNMIQAEKIIHDRKTGLKEKQLLLEQSFSDSQSSVKDIKRLQMEIIDMKSKMNKELVNTERWDPRFIYYLMIQENYNYDEINEIKSLRDSGLSAEEINTINDLIKEDSFLERIKAFKGGNEKVRVIASTKPHIKERDEFIDDDHVVNSLDSKLIEMDYSPEERDEMIHGHNLQ